MIQITKKSALALAVTTALWGATAVADNNDTATATVSGEVIASLAIADSAAGMDFPTIVKPDTGEDTFATLTCDNAGGVVIAYDALGGNPYAEGVTSATTAAVGSANVTGSNGSFVASCASFDVTGEASYHYNLVGTTTITTAALDTGLVLSGLNCMASGGTATDGTLSGAGTATVYCGATVTVDETAATGAFTNKGLITVGVVYD